MENNTLNHAGIKGMRWGIRRFQNKDGSLTPLGKKRRRQETTDQDNESSKPDTKPKTSKEMSDEELTKSIRRLELETRYNQLAAQTNTVSRGKRFINDLIDKSIVPAVTEAGRNLLKDSLMKAGKQYLGLTEELSELDKLRKEVDTIELKKRKAIAEDYFNKRNSKGKK